MPGRAVRNELTEALLAQNPPPIVTCDHCLKRCSRRYCILDVLNKAQRGDVKGGLVFSGISASKIKEILPVAEIIKRLIKEVEGACSIPFKTVYRGKGKMHGFNRAFWGGRV